MRNRSLATVIALAALASTLAGCSGSSSTDASTASASAPASSTKPSINPSQTYAPPLMGVEAIKAKATLSALGNAVLTGMSTGGTMTGDADPATAITVVDGTGAAVTIPLNGALLFLNDAPVGSASVSLSSKMPFCATLGGYHMTNTTREPEEGLC